MKNIIIGWVTIRPGQRAAFLAAVKAHVDATRVEPGCLFFEINLSRDDENQAVVTECWSTAAAHERHNQAAHSVAFHEALPKLLSFGHFENVNSGTVAVNEVHFD